MHEPIVSVIIPTYNGAPFIGETIKSVFRQTYRNFELIIVDDASTDQTVDVIRQFEDERLKYISHEKNEGSEVARNTGLTASCGDIICFLDQDDLFHPEKLERHVSFMELHPDVGVTYNPRFNLNHSSTTIRDLWCPPRILSLADLVTGFPLSPSDVVLRRKWALQMDLLNGSLSWCGGEIIHYGKLYLAGCKFAMVERSLNYRRYHSGRIIKDIAGGCEAEIFAQDKIFNDPSCPAAVLALKDQAHANFYMNWAYRALAQGETKIGLTFLNEAIQLKPAILSGMPSELVEFFLMGSIEDENLDHEYVLNHIFAQLPPEMSQITKQKSWAIGKGFLLKGIQAILWDRSEIGLSYFRKADRLGGQIEESLVGQVTQDLLNMKTEFGEEIVFQKIQTLKSHLEKFGSRTNGRILVGSYYINSAFQSFRAGEFRKVPHLAFNAIKSDPRYFLNRGVLSIISQSIFRREVKSGNNITI